MHIIVVMCICINQSSFIMSSCQLMEYHKIIDPAFKGNIIACIVVYTWGIGPQSGQPAHAELLVRLCGGPIVAC